ncbi:OmpA family protein [Maricaulis maris]|uniref:Outer membrane protein OmpA-like peptidoglycan-associated protein n=1 Tax=Maricaulis maris TaxID=74318 RepID=A0A495DDV0_9PROT|nr:OmpA family protein [Maricaulis maris]RKR00443.1 outer membrane protein OmpA-like peptidoglycan-associated protein [Maricaulis maris]
MRKLLLSALGCLSVVAGAHAQPPKGVPVLQPWETAIIEHNDRRDRIQRLSERYGDQLIRYEEYLVERLEHDLPDFPADIPVLQVIFDQQIFFEFDQTVIRPEAEDVIQVISESLQHEPPDVVLFIAGHTDAFGTQAYNYDLGVRRADAVATELARRGVYQGEIYRVSFGESVPVASNSTADGRALNRRVEFLFGSKREALAIWLEAQEIAPCSDTDLGGIADCREQVVFSVEPVSVRFPSQRQTQLSTASHNLSPGVDDRSLTLNDHTTEQLIAPSTATVDIAPVAFQVDLSRPRRVVRVTH